MNKLIYLIFAALCLAGSAVAESLSIEDQTRIITEYGRATGQIRPPSSVGVEDSLPPDKCGTSAVLNFVLNRDRLDPALLAALGVQLEPRPVLPKSYRSPDGHFLVHYDTIGANAVYQPTVRMIVDSVPDFVVMTARIADSVYTHIIDTLGYPAPPIDGTAGGNSAYDVYLLDVGEEYFGLTYVDSVTGPLTTTSFLELDNDFRTIAKYANRPLDAVRVTMAHEYFHAVQFGIDYREEENPGQVNARPYWKEMSAVWMEEEIYDDINDYYVYLPYFFNDLRVSLQAFGAAYKFHPYGAGVFPMYLAQRYGKQIIKDIWLDCGVRGAGPQFLEACDAAVRAADPPDGSLATAINEFSIWNYFTGQYSSVAPAGIGYEERANYPALPIGTILRVGRYPDFFQIGTGPYRPEYNGTGYVLLQNLDTRVGCEGVDTSANPDTAVTIPCDSVLPIYIGVQHPTLIEWGIAVIYQLADYPDSMEINRFVVPLVGDSATVFFEIDAFHPNRYRSIAIAVSPTSNDYTNYSRFTAPGVGYAISDSGSAITRPSAVLTPYPNPAVIADMGGRELTFRFQVAADTLNSNITGNPLLSIDIYSVAGELVKSIEATFGGEDRLGVHAGGRYETTWDMQNAAAKNVASGVYLAYARLWKAPDKKNLLAESTVKVALVR